MDPHIQAPGTIRTVAWTEGVPALPMGDGDPAVLATICRPDFIALGGDGSVYITDWQGERDAQFLQRAQRAQ